jgi:DNA repair exonuclease SbcCD ATPase subunit
MRQFPIMVGSQGTAGPCPSSIPWEVIAPYEGQAQANHGQTLERLAQRGGLDPGEAYLVMTGRCWKGETFTPEFEKAACAFLDKIVRDRGELQTENTRLKEESANWQESAKNLTAAALDLRTDLDATKQKLAEAEKLKQGYYDEAAEGWKKFRDAERQIEEIKKTFAIHSCPPEDRFCWLCAAREKIEKALSQKPLANDQMEGPRNPPEPAPRIERQNPEAGEF